MEATTVIRRPLISEKSTQGSENNRYAFEVDPRATKPQIRAALQELYKVRVLSVATLVRQAAEKRTRVGVIPGKVTKKAIVKLHPDDRIEII